MPESFEAVVRPDGDVTVMDLHGEINAFARERLEEAYEEAMEDDPARLLLNFKDVGYINSTGIALIVGILAKARTAHLRVLACGLSDHYQEIFTITRLADFMSIYPDEETAVGEATSLAT